VSTETQTTRGLINPPTQRPAAESLFAARDPLSSVALRLRVNGAEREVAVEPWTTLLDVGVGEDQAGLVTRFNTIYRS
jgi:hypothetical protein